MLSSKCLVLLALVGTALATHVEWPDYDHLNHSPDGRRKNDQEGQFQGYPTNHPPASTSAVSITSTETTVPGHRELLKGIFQQVLGSNFTSPGLTDLAFLSFGRPSLPLKSKDVDYQQTSYEPAAQGPFDAQAEHSAPHYELAEFIQPPPPPVNDYNYYYQ